MTVAEARVVQVGIDHRAMGAEAFGRLLEAGWNTDLPRPPDGGGIVALATCHRRELYLEGTDPLRALALFEAWAGEAARRGPRPEVRTGTDAGRHLLRVAAGLESAVLGEDQVLGQVRAAYREACHRRTAGPALHRLFHAAFRAGKRVRSETALARGERSLAGAAVGWLASRTGGLRDRTVLVLGAGEMARVAVRRLLKRGAGRVLVSNRTLERARDLVEGHGGEVVPWRWWPALLGEVDGLVVATGAAEPVVGEAELRPRVAPLAVVDLAVPRNVEPPRPPVPGVEIAGVGELAGRLAREAGRRSRAVEAAERIVEEELEAWWGWLRNRGGGSAPGCTGGRSGVSAG